MKVAKFLFKEQSLASEYIQPENGAVVGDDGELLQPDMTAYPDYYTNYKAPYVHRNGLLLGIYDNLRENGFAYLLLSPITFIGTVIAFLAAISLIIFVVDSVHNFQTHFGWTATFLAVGGIVLILAIGARYLAKRLPNYSK